MSLAVGNHISITGDDMLDPIQCASQLGRLDFLSALLACIGIILTLGGVAAFFSVRRLAKDVAKKEAEQSSEYHASRYIQNNLERLIKEHLEWRKKHGLDKED